MVVETASYDPATALARAEKPPSFRSLIALPVIRALCASQWMLGFIAACFNIVFVLVAYTPIEDGGLGMNVRFFTSSP